MWQTNPHDVGHMINKKNTNKRVKPEEQYGLRIAGEILHEFLENSNEPLAVAYRKHFDENEEENAEGDQLFRDLWPDTELSIDLKLLTRKPGRLPVGVPVDGSIINDGDDHFTFVENAIRKMEVVVQRNPIVYRGKYINIHKREDGTLYPTFNRPHFDKNLTFQDFCRKAAKELIVFACLVKEV